MNVVGAIISAYPGVGKSTLSKKDLKYIDLESSYFSNLGPDWATTYYQVACDLASQGYYVFVSSHGSVRQMMSLVDKSLVHLPCDCPHILLMQVYPSVLLKDDWSEKLYQRYMDSKEEKDYRALIAHTGNDFLERMPETELGSIVLEDMDYNLQKAIEDYIANKLQGEVTND